MLEQDELESFILLQFFVFAGMILSEKSATFCCAVLRFEIMS